MLVAAFLARQPETRFTSDEVTDGLDGKLHQSIVQGSLRRQLLTRVISSEPGAMRRIRYYVTQRQANAIHRELREIAASFMRWVPDGSNASVLMPQVLPPVLPKPASVVKVDPMEAAGRLTYLRRLQGSTVFGGDAVFKRIIADYEAALASARAAE